MASITKTRGRKAAATRRTLLNAALEVMSRKGYSAATIDEIAKEAGVSKGLAYYHFKSKGQMATEILTDGVNDLIDTFEMLCEKLESGKTALLQMLNAFCDKVAGDLHFGRFYLSALWREGMVWSDGMHEIAKRLIDGIATQFARGKEEGSVRADLDPEFAAVASIGLVLTTAMRYFSDSAADELQMDKEEFTKSVVNFVTRATAV